MYYIYALYKANIVYKTNTIDEHLFYIGITSSDKNLYFRMKNHKRDKSNPYKLNIIAKYDFVLKILWNIESQQEAEAREEFLIRWFGKRVDKSGILTNILSSSKDYSRIRKMPTQATKNKISKALKKIHQNQDIIAANRDRNLTVPYGQVIKLVEEWAKNPLETQQSFADRNGLNRSKFKDWLRLYKPEYIGLTKKKQKEIFNSIDKKNKKPIEIIKEYAKISGYTEQQAHGIYYRLIKQNE